MIEGVEYAPWPVNLNLTPNLISFTTEILCDFSSSLQTDQRTLNFGVCYHKFKTVILFVKDNDSLVLQSHYYINGINKLLISKIKIFICDFWSDCFLNIFYIILFFFIWVLRFLYMLRSWPVTDSHSLINTLMNCGIYKITVLINVYLFLVCLEILF